jgi:hypothetical protein
MNRKMKRDAERQWARLYEKARAACVEEQHRRGGKEINWTKLVLVPLPGAGMSKRSRDKGQRTERAIVRLLRDRGVVCEKISGMYRPGADLCVPLLGAERGVEVKCRTDGFRELYKWLDNRDVLS